MEQSRIPVPTNKKEYIAEIGKILVAENGKKEFYKPKEVKKAHQQSSWADGLDFSCWAMSIFSSHSDFDNYKTETGDRYDYSSMKMEMIRGLSTSPTGNGAELPDLDIDASWLDFGEVFEGLLGGIGAFIGGIFDGV